MALAGTTTATVLTRAIFSEGCKSVAAGMNPMDLRRGINAAVEKVLAYLKHHAKMISTTEEIAQVGSTPELFCTNKAFTHLLLPGHMVRCRTGKEYDPL